MHLGSQHPSVALPDLLEPHAFSAVPVDFGCVRVYRVPTRRAAGDEWANCPSDLWMVRYLGCAGPGTSSELGSGSLAAPIAGVRSAYGGRSWLRFSRWRTHTIHWAFS